MHLVLKTTYIRDGEFEMKLFKLGLIITLLFSVTACSQTQKQQDVLRLGVMKSLDALPIIIAEQQGYFEDLGIEIDIQVFSSAKDRDAALQAGQLDGMITDGVALTLFANAGLELQSVTTTSGRFSLIASSQSSIQTLEDLANTKIAISQNTMIDYLSYQLVVAGNVDPNSVEFVGIPAIPVRLESLNNGQIDAAVLPAPFDEIAISQGARKIDSFYNDEIQLSHIAFTKSFIDANTKTVKDFLKAYDLAIDYLVDTDISEYEDLVIEAAGYPASSKGNIVLPPLSHHSKPSAEKLQSVIDWSMDRGLISTKIDPQSLIWQ